MDTTKNFPPSPGVYLHKNINGDVIYVGKAKNLRKRVSSYFKKKHPDHKTELLTRNISSTDYIVTNNELEALLLENRLIKKHQPKYNIELKESARYFYIQITKENFPRILITRKTNKKDRFFGPYTSNVSDITKIIRDLFKLRNCKMRMPKRSCIYFDLNLCAAPCENKISKEEYKKHVGEAIKLIRFGNEELANQYEKQMTEFAKKLEFEKAQECKKKIELLKILKQRQAVDLQSSNDYDAIGIATKGDKAHISLIKNKKGIVLKKEDFTFLASDEILNEFLKAYYSNRPVPNEIIVATSYDKEIEKYLSNIWGRKIKIRQPKHGIKLDLLNLARKNAYASFNLEDFVLIEMKEMLQLNHMPHIIDCFDISNFGETAIVGACVQFKNKEPNKSEWRTYNIRGNFGQDDFRSIHEVIKRRYEKHPLPDLIIIDGGTIQVDFATRALKELQLNCKVIGLGKKEETIFFPNGKNFKLNRRLAASKLIMKIRDATHNFVIRNSRNRFKKIYKESELDNIPGIGNITKFTLLRKLGSIENIKKTSLKKLVEIIGSKRGRIIFLWKHNTD